MLSKKGNRNQKLWYFVFSIVIILAFMLTSCASPTQPPEPVETEEVAQESQPPEGEPEETEAQEPPAASGAVRLGLVLGDMSNPFWGTVAEGAQAAADSAGNVELTVLGSQNLEDEVKVFEDLISTQVDVIGVAPWDAQGIVPSVEKANEANIPVITVDETAAGGEIVAYIATDNVEGGRKAGEWLAKAMGGTGKLAILEGGAGSSTNNARLEGLLSVIDETDVEVVASLPADWVRDKGLQVMNDILTANPELDAVMAMNDEMALGALEALKAAGRDNEVVIVGYNGALEAIKSVYDGGLGADIVQYPEQMGSLFVEWALKTLNGEQPPEFHIKPNVDVVDTQFTRKAMAAITGQPLDVSANLNISPESAVRLGLVLGDMSNPFWGTVAEAAQAAADSAGNVELTVLGSQNLEDEVKVFEDLISTQVDVIGVAPWDAQGIVPSVEKANEANIPVITVDETAAGGEIVAYIATDNVEGGRKAGEWLAKAMGGTGKLAILEGGAGSSTNNARLEGLLSVIDETDVEVVASLPADWVRDKGLQVMNDILTANPELDAVMAMNDEMALGALEALNAAGREDEVLIVGYNGALEAIKSAYDGGLASDVVQYPEQMGRLFVEWALRTLNGEQPPEFHIKPNVDVGDTQLLKKLNQAVTGQ
ncbi:sugar ABC transporter substrate-binding protein [Chloroflexota bacterium]